VIRCWNVVFHQDIKPGNIFLKTDTKKGEIVAKLADFGFSESIYTRFHTKRDDEIEGCNAWTPGYEAPEFPNLSGASDVWQLVVTIACVYNGTVRPWSWRTTEGDKWDHNEPAGPHYLKNLNGVLR
jgi:serine/threonine protein kinase